MSQQDSNRERDLVLAPNEFAFISDQTKGQVNVYVGPYKTSLANTDKPVIFDNNTKRFERCNLDESIQVFSTAPEGWYVVLKNPAKDNNQPRQGTSNSLTELNIGRKVNIPGPVFFALWPGQMAKVIPGHHLRSNQYLLVRVYDEEQAYNNWKNAVVKAKSLNSEEGNETSDIVAAGSGEMPDLTMGKLLLIKGVNVSFYIPPTGVEVVPDESGEYVRDAVTLERMEYCILLDEDGNKYYIHGPAVVFPKPTEEFIEHNGSRKFRAIELNEISGLYIKVIAPYTENGREYKEGEELFITGKEQMIYYPRPEHAIIKYGDQERHFAIAIPAGEGRYYLNRMTGTVSLKRGPAMFLPDPRTEVLVRRILDPDKVQLWFPGNQAALEYNKRLAEINQSQQQGYLSDSIVRESLMQQSNVGNIVPPPPQQEKEKSKKRETASAEALSEEFKRSNQFTQPRMITLDTRYEGAVTINLKAAYAVMAVSKTGNRRVMVGPQAFLLEYDENLEVIELSTGTPKTDSKLLRTVYLRVLQNKISDIVIAETADYCSVRCHLSYRVNFEGDPNLWFNVENYVKFLVENMRSIIRNFARRYSIKDFYANSVEVLRDMILSKPGEDGKRPGRFFPENGMRIYDVEVFDVKIEDSSIEKILIADKQDAFRQELRLQGEQRQLEYTQKSEAISREIMTIQADTRIRSLELQRQELEKQLVLTMKKMEAEIQQEQTRLTAKLEEQNRLAEINAVDLGIRQSQQELELAYQRKQMEQYIERMQAEVQGIVAKANAVSPDLIAALQAFGDKALAEKMADSMAPLAILGGKSIVEVFANLLSGTKLGKVLAFSSESTAVE